MWEMQPIFICQAVLMYQMDGWIQKRIGFAMLQGQYLVASLGPNASYTLGTAQSQLMTLTPGKLSKAVIRDTSTPYDLNMSSNRYLQSYHYFRNAYDFDMLLYTSTSTFYNNISIKRTNLIYNGEEDQWYYFKPETFDSNGVQTGGTKENTGYCTVLSSNQDLTSGTFTDVLFTMDTVFYYNEVTESVDKDTGQINQISKRRKVTVSTSQKVKMFFEEYGYITEEQLQQVLDYQKQSET